MWSSSTLGRLTTPLDDVYVKYVFDAKGQATGDATDITLAIDISGWRPAAAFIAPSFGFTQCRFLPVIESMSKAKESSLTRRTQARSHKTELHWATEFLQHCHYLLESELGRPLKGMSRQISLTTQGDASEGAKAALLKAAEASGFITSSEGAAVIVPAIEALTVGAVMDHLISTPSSGLSTPTFQIRPGDNILTIHFSGDLINMQSYSVSRTEANDDALGDRVILEETICGCVVNCGKIIDNEFIDWCKKSQKDHQSSDFQPYSTLMVQFAEFRRNYEPEKQNHFQLIPASNNTPRQPWRLSDQSMSKLFQPGMDFLISSLDKQLNDTLGKSKTINQILFAGLENASPYLEWHVKDWGIGAGILNTDIRAFPAILGSYWRVDAT